MVLPRRAHRLALPAVTGGRDGQADVPDAVNMPQMRTPVWIRLPPYSVDTELIDFELEYGAAGSPVSAQIRMSVWSASTT
jgi:hypothetical protein